MIAKSGKTTGKIAALIVLMPLLLGGCAMFDLFGSGTPRMVEGDANGIAVKNGSDTDQRELAASHCGSFNKSAVLEKETPEDRRADIVRFACR